MMGRGTGAALSRVLLVEDEPDIRLVVRLSLEAAGLVVAEAGDGEEAVRLASSFMPQLILLDVELPGPDAVDALAKLRLLPGLRDVPVALLTAHAGSAAVDALRQCGVLAVLVKPMDPLRLGRLLGDLWAEWQRTAGGRPAAPEALQWSS